MGPASIEVLLIKKKPDYNLIKRVLKSITQVSISFFYIDTDEIAGFFLLLKNHVFIARSEDTGGLYEPERDAA